MKSVGQLTILAFSVLFLARGTYAQEASPRTQFQAAVAADQKTHTRETALKVIELSKQLDPPPAVPEEAREPFVMGVTVLKKAGDSAGAAKAVELFTQSLNTAPWFAEAYYNRALARETAGQFTGAMDDLKLYLEFKLGESERREVQDKIYSLKADAALAIAKKAEEQNIAAAKAAEEKKAALAAQAEAERKRPTVVGKWDSGPVEFEVIRSGQRFIVTSVEVLGEKGYATNVSIDEHHVRFTSVYSMKSSHDLTLSESGNELIGRSGTNEGAKFVRRP